MGCGPANRTNMPRKRYAKNPVCTVDRLGDEVKDSVKMRESGVDRIVAKPFEIPHLLQLIREVVPESFGESLQTAGGLLH